MHGEPIDFPHTGPDFPHMSSPQVEEAVRELARNLAVTVGTGAAHQFGAVHLRKAGFAGIAQLQVTVTCKDADLSSLIPVCRQKAFVFLAERGVDDRHLRAVPSVSREGRRRRFTDQHGQARFGQQMTVSFDLSDTLASAVQWDWTGTGQLPAVWEL